MSIGAEALYWGVTYSRHTRGRKDERTNIRRPFVAHDTSLCEQCSNRICLDTGAEEVGSPEGCSLGGFLGLDEFFLGVGFHGLVVSVAEQRGHDGEVGSVGEDCAEGNGRGLDRREVVETI